MALYSHAKPYKSVLTSPCRMEPRCRFSTSMVKRTINAALCLDVDTIRLQSRFAV